MEEQNYEITEVALVGGGGEQNIEMIKNGEVPNSFRKNQIRRDSMYLPIGMNQIVLLNKKVAEVSGEITSSPEEEEEKEKRLNELKNKVIDTKLRLAVANAALNFYRGDDRAQGFGGLQITMASGNTIQIHSGVFDNQQDRIIEVDSEGKRIPKPDIEKILAALSTVNTATHALSLLTGDGHSYPFKAKIPYTQPNEMQNITVETKENNGDTK